jgi:SAM-dependent methyltransferase
MTELSPEEQSRRLATDSLAGGDSTGWFERLYVAAEQGTAVVPWDRETPNPLLVEWAKGRDGKGLRALVVGAGLGRDAEYIASLGFDTVAFDVSPTAVEGARRRHPHSPVRYEVADLLDPPADWRQVFDLVVESMTVQSLPDPPRDGAIANVAELVATGGTLIVIALAHSGQPLGDGPPWQLARREIDAFAATGLVEVTVEEIADPPPSPVRRWRAEFHRPAHAVTPAAHVHGRFEGL